MRRLIERRSRSRASSADDSLDALYAAAPPRVKEWMRRKARLADGTRPGLPVLDASTVERALRRASEQYGNWPVHRPRKILDGWRLVRTGVLRDCCSLGFREIGVRRACSSSQVRRDYELHRALVVGDERYAELVAEVVKQALPAGS